MRFQRYWQGFTMVALWVTFVLTTSCSVDDVGKPDDEQYVNPDKPNANALIVSQTTFGDIEKGSSIYLLTPEPGGGYYFAGLHDSRYGMGHLSATGGLTWFTRTGYRVRDICLLPPSAIAPNALAVVWSVDTDGDDESDIGYLSLYGSTGSLLDQVVYTADTSDVWLNSIATISDSTFVVVGGEGTAGVSNPFIATVALTSPDQMEKRHHSAIDEMPGRIFDNVATDPSEIPGSELSLYVLSDGADSQSEYRTIGVHKISAALPTLIPRTVEWSQEIVVASGLGTYAYSGSGLIFSQDNLYLVGAADDPGKEPTPSNGGYWGSGLAASLTPTGGLRWLTSVALTGHSERFRAMAMSSGALYAVGDGASFGHSDHEYGYGLISEIALETGDVISNMTFGEDSYNSGFNYAVISGNSISCGGWTQYESAGGAYPAWFCEIDVSAPPTTCYGPPASPAASGHGTDEADYRQTILRPDSDL